MHVFKWSTSLSSSIYRDSLAIRKQVFIREQNVSPELEIDELEEQCYYVTVYLDDKPVGTARLYLKDDQTGKVQRVAVLPNYRGQNIGYALMKEVERYARQLNLTRLVLGAQNHAIPFYERLRYQVVGPEYVDANILHHDMEKTL